MADKEENVQDTSDYKLRKDGRKVKAHRIIFNKGEDDGKKGISEMKKSYKDFVIEHTAELTEEQKNEIVAELQEVLGKNAEAGDWISDFVHSDNPKFAGKSKEKRKQMALAAYYSKQRNEEVVDEELKGNQHKLDKNKNGKLDKHDFKLLRKEENMEESQSHQSKTTMKHVSNPTAGEKKAAKDIKPGIAGYRDRVAMLKSAEARGALKKEEIANESVFDWKNKARQTSDSGKTKTYHDVKKTSTGTVYTKQFDKDGMSKGTGGDAAAKAENAPKRGRGRPKKDKFAEAVEFLLALSEETFDDMMEEGFDAFIESYEQLDELSKTTLGSYARKAAASAVSHTAKAQHSTAQAQDARNRAKDPKLAFARSGNETIAKSQADRAVKANVKAGKRLSGVSKAIDRLTK
jgi:hypothetical protein